MIVFFVRLLLTIPYSVVFVIELLDTKPVFGISLVALLIYFPKLIFVLMLSMFLWSLKEDPF